jgi:hypothetical protein
MIIICDSVQSKIGVYWRGSFFIYFLKKTNYMTWFHYFKGHDSIWKTKVMVAASEVGKPI